MNNKEFETELVKILGVAVDQFMAGRRNNFITRYILKRRMKKMILAFLKSMQLKPFPISVELEGKKIDISK